MIHLADPVAETAMVQEGVVEEELPEGGVGAVVTASAMAAVVVSEAVPPDGGRGRGSGGGSGGEGEPIYDGFLAEEAGWSLLHDDIWRKYALRQLRHVSSDDDCGLGHATYSIITTCPVASTLLNIQRFVDVVAPEPTGNFAEPVGGANGGFEFFDDENVRHPVGEDRLTVDDPIVSRVLFFKVVSVTVSQAHVVPNAPKVKGFDSIIISICDLKAFDLKNQVARVFIREEDDQADRMLVITPSTFSVDEWRSIVKSKPLNTLHHSFGVRVEERLEEVGSPILEKLLATDFVCTPTSKDHALQHKFLTLMETYNYVYRERAADTWRLTASGKSTIDQSYTIKATRKVMKTKANTTTSDCTTLELHYLLERDRWHGEHPPLNSKSKPLAYVIGNPKVWYLSRSAKTFSHNYFLALLLADVHKQPVEPFRSATHYQDIINGTPPSERRAREHKHGFDFNAQVHPDHSGRRLRVKTPDKSKGAGPDEDGPDAETESDECTSTEKEGESGGGEGEPGGDEPGGGGDGIDSSGDEYWDLGKAMAAAAASSSSGKK
jgi:hypothetical protein